MNTITEITEGALFKRNENVQIRTEEDGYYLLFNSISQQTLLINETGKYIWECCTGANSIQKIIELITDHFEMNSEMNQNIDSIVIDFILILNSKDLIQQSEI